MPKTETNGEKTSDFKNELDSIIDTPLSVENIDSYAQIALDDLIRLMQSIREAYEAQSADTYEDNKQLEDAALKHFGLTPLGEILDHVANKAQELEHLDSLIASVPETEAVITPPEATEMVIAPGEEPANLEKKALPKLKALLFVLKNSFDIDLDDPTQIQILKGSVRNNMVRRLPYYLVSVNKLGRQILICDEADNVTYILNSAELLSLGISADKLIDYTKPQLNDLLDENKQAGSRMPYSQNFVPRLIAKINNPVTEDKAIPDTSETAPSYLLPKPPEDVVSVLAIANDLGIDRSTVRNAISQLAPELGEIFKYNFGGGRPKNGYNQEQQAIIKQYLAGRNLLVPPAPEGYLSLGGMAQALGIPTRSVVEKAVQQLGNRLGEVAIYRFGGRRVPGYSLEQQKQIRALLEESGYFDSPPDGYLTINGVAISLDTQHAVVQRAIKDLGDQLGTIEEYKSAAGKTGYYSPAQQEMILDYLEARGLFGEEPPEGYLSIAGIAKGYGVDHATVAKSIDAVRGSLGEVQRYKFFGHSTEGYSPQQQELIKRELEKNNLFVEMAPEGTLTFPGLMKALGFGGDETLKKVISVLTQEGRLGEVKYYRFGKRHKPAQGYSLEQQALIRDYLSANNLIDNDPPEGFSNAPDLARALGVSYNHIRIAIDELGDQLGETRQYKSKAQIVTHYSPEQQNIIKSKLEERGFIGTNPPAGYVPISVIAKEAGVSHYTAKRAAEILESALGEVKSYRFSAGPTLGYSPEQQLMVIEYLRRQQ